MKALVPILNTIEGRVKETISPYRGLLKYPQVKICDEYWMKIEHCLASITNNLRNIRKIISHPQALGQCKKYIESLEKQLKHSLELVEVPSTSLAAKLVTKNGEAAAICSEEAAEYYGLNVLTKNIEDRYNINSENWTRFVVLADKDCEEPTGKDKTTLTMELIGQEKPRTLRNALDIFTQNISYIESMVKGSKTEYVFWLDIDEHRKNMQEELEKLTKLTKWLYLHGSYPRKVP